MTDEISGIKLGIGPVYFEVLHSSLGQAHFLIKQFADFPNCYKKEFPAKFYHKSLRFLVQGQNAC